MFLYTKKDYRSTVLQKAQEKDENYFSLITKEQTVFCEAMTELAINYYRDLYHAHGDKKCIMESDQSFFEKVKEFLKKLRDRVVTFISKWYNKLKELVYGKDKGSRIKRLLDDPKAVTALAGYKYRSNQELYLYHPFFSEIKLGIDSIFRFGDDPTKFITSDELNKKSTNGDISVLDDSIKEHVKAWKGLPTNQLDINDIKTMYENLDEMVENVDKLKKDVDKYFKKFNSAVEAWRNNCQDTYTPQVATKLTAYGNSISEYLKMLLATSTQITTSFTSIFNAFASDADAYMAEQRW